VNTEMAEMDNDELKIWYDLFVDDKKIGKSYINFIQGLNVTMIKKQVKKDSSPDLDKIAAIKLEVFSGINNENQLLQLHTKQLDPAEVWNRKIHGGGTHNPLIVKANEQSTYLLYKCKTICFILYFFIRCIYYGGR
jgi:hypothetical protein